MARVRLKFSTSQRELQELRDEIVSDLKRRIRNTFADIRPFVEDAINAGVEESRGQFIPDDREAAELGVGQGGQIDTSRTEGAYKQIRTDSSNSVTSFSIRKQRQSARDNLIGAITVTIDEDELFNSNLARIDTPDAVIEEIPWLRWLIMGAPTNPDFGFVGRSNAKSSRTGGGIMVVGGLWSFPPARIGAIPILSNTIERRISNFIREDIGDVL